ncbi:hypothetical protein I79_008607 [Cricetulus griseus]|uniref:Uncharacterized protein n=1 Tax=Cricetulus griseus TaxID=10029 RepID=G3HDM2_CRIGR|nr:hypothetical protein I79_008607 [Cricetulus griseus]
MDLSKRNSVLPNGMELGLSYCQHGPGSYGMSTQFNTNWKVTHNGSQSLMQMGILQRNIPLSTTFPFLPQACSPVTLLKH